MMPPWGAIGRLPRLVEGSEIADVEGEETPVLGRGKGELFLVGGRVVADFFGPHDIKAPAAQIDGQPGHDVAVEVQADEERFKGD